MAAHKEVLKWSETLSNNEKQLESCIQYLNQDKSIKPHKKSQNSQAYKILINQISAFQKHCKKLENEAEISDSHLIQARSNYSRLHQNIEDFKNPITKTESYKIFKRLSNLPKSSPPPVKPTPVFAEKPITTSSLCQNLNKIVHELKSHSHKSYTDRLSLLESSTNKLKCKSKYLQQELTDHLKQCESIKARIRSLESQNQ